MAGNNFDIKDLFGTDGTKKITSDLDLVIKKLDDFQKKVVEAGTAINKQLAERILTMSKLNFGNVKDLERFLKASKEQVSDLQTKNELSKQEQKLAQEKIKTEKLKLQLETQLKRAKEQTEKAEKKKTEAEKKSLDIYQQRRKANNELLNQLRALEAAGKGQSKTFAQLKKGALEERAALDKLDESYGRHFHNVGNYKQAVKEALSELSLFDDKILGVVNSFKNYLTSIKNAEGATKKFNTILKGAGILLLVGVVASLNEVAKSQKKVSDGFESIKNQTSNFFSTTLQNFDLLITGRWQEFAARLAISIKQTKDITKETQNWRKTIVELNNELKENAQIEQDIQGNVQDSTLTSQTRNKKLEEYNKVRKRSLEIERDIVKENLKIVQLEAQRQLATQGISATLEDTTIYETKQKEQILSLVSDLKIAEKNLSIFRGDLEKQERERIDRRLEKELIFLRNKRTGNKQIADELTSQINDERLQINERQNAIDKLAEHEKRITATTLDFIRKAAEERLVHDDVIGTSKEVELKKLQNINAEYLVNEKNAEELSKKINSLALSETQRETLNQQIKLAYQAQNDVLTQQVKLDKEREAIILRIQKINNEINKSERAFNSERIEIERKNIELSGEQVENEIFNQQLFNQKKIGLRKKLFDEEIKIADESYEAEKERLELELFERADIAAKTIVDKKELEAELKKIDQEITQEEIRLAKKQSEKKKEIATKEAEFEKKLRIDQIKEIARDTNTLLEYTGQAQQKRFDKINSDINSQIEKNSEALAAQRERAAQGQANDVATYEENAEKLALAQQREAKRQEKMQEYLAFIKLFSGYAESDPEHALQKTLKDIALMQVAKIAYLNEGTDFVNADNKTIKASKHLAKGKDVIPAMLARGEAVITNAANAEYKGVSEAMNNFRFDEFVRENYLPKMLLAPQQSFANNVYQSAQLNELIKLNSRIENLENAIIKKRENIFNLDNLGNMVTTTVENGMKHTVKFIQQKPRLK